MTLPGAIGYGAPPPGGALQALVRRIEDLERTVRGMSSMLVNNGELAVNDASGNRLITTGADVGGLSAHDPTSGDELALHALAFGGIAVETVAAFTAPGGGAWHTDPLESTITVDVSTGRLLVTVSAVQFSSLSASNVVMSWTLSGPTNVAADNQRGLVTATADFPAAGYASGSYTFLHTGLAPGRYTVQSNYRCDRYGAPADSGIFENRALIVQPY